MASTKFMRVFGLFPVMNRATVDRRDASHVEQVLIPSVETFRNRMSLFEKCCLFVHDQEKRSARLTAFERSKLESGSMAGHIP